MILLYADPHEVRYVDYCLGWDRMHIEIGAPHINTKMVKYVLSQHKRVILFGSSGLVQDNYCCITDWDTHKVPYDEFIIPYNWNGIKVDGECCAGYTSKHPVKEQWERGWLRNKRVMVVDMESAIVAKVCQGLGVKFTSVRYIIDKCDRKCMPIGINHFWRKFQHRRMQLKFNRWLNENRI